MWFGVNEEDHRSLRTRIEPANRLNDLAGHAIQGKGGWWCVRAIPGSIPTRRRTQGCPGRNGCVVRDIRNGDGAATLGKATIPQLRNGLPIGKGELKTPAVESSCARIGNGQTCSKAS